MRRSGDSVRTRVTSVLGVLGLVVSVFAAGASAHGAAAGPPPPQSISDMILVHNTIVGEAYDEFNGTLQTSIYGGDLEQCEEVELESGEAQEIGLLGLSASVAPLVGTVENVYGEFNNHTVPGWITLTKGFKRTVAKGDRATVAHAAKLLEEAHIEHTDEFFHMKRIWVAMEGAHCATAAKEDKATEKAGSAAWTFEAAALRRLAGLFGVKDKIEYAAGPYV
jgi:hypothetical protein